MPTSTAPSPAARRAAEDVLLVARAYRWVRELPFGSNGGQAVERFQRVTGNAKGDAWCASFVAAVGTDALGKRWPLPLTAGCQALADFATRRGILRTTPEVGDVVLFYHHGKYNRYAHTGFVAAVAAGGRSFETVEGNTSDPAAHAGSEAAREGWGVFEKTHAVTADTAFVRWTDLLAAAGVAA